MQDFAPYYDLMEQHRLFDKIDRKNFPGLLRDCEAKVIPFKEGDNVKAILDMRPGHVCGCVLSGLVQVFKNDAWGNQPILDINMKNYLIGYYDVFSNADLADIHVKATKAGEILFLNAEMLESPPEGVNLRQVIQMQHNLIAILSESNWKMIQKVDIISAKTMREKILRMLKFEVRVQGSFSFDIPFSRRELADYIYVDRSALSRELGRMKAEGLIEYERNHFEILSPARKLLQNI